MSKGIAIATCALVACFTGIVGFFIGAEGYRSRLATAEERAVQICRASQRIRIDHDIFKF